ncbi:hypothetical protein HUJ04_008552 [Dendroctonus ponderosae]|nr:hypothetical protein HUJ04_008552 [Dendroctonus ponderosae]
MWQNKQAVHLQHVPENLQAEAPSEEPHRAMPHRFICPKCLKAYSYKYNLNRHLKYECGNLKPFRCCICEKSFTQKSTLITHTWAVHRINAKEINLIGDQGLVMAKRF